MKDFASFVLLLLVKIMLKTNIIFFLSVHCMGISEKYSYVLIILVICILSLILCVLKIRKKLFNSYSHLEIFTSMFYIKHV